MREGFLTKLPARSTAALALAGCVTLGTALALQTPSSGDYSPLNTAGGDTNAAPAVNALLHGSLSGYAARQPLMGPVSLLLRAPFVALARALGGGELLQYRIGALACTLPVAALAAWLLVGAVSARGRREGERDTRLVALVAVMLGAYLILDSPATRVALSAGHPEEPLTAALTVIAVLMAARGRGLLAGLTLGLALASKEWALIALLPVALALPAGQRRRGLLVAAGVAAAIMAAPVLTDPGALLHDVDQLSNRHMVTAASIWWPIGTTVPGAPLHTVRWLPTGLTRLRLAAVLLALVAGIWGLARWRRGRPVPLRDPLALLALLGLARAAADPFPQEYYFAAVLIPLVAWELMTLRRLPLAALIGALYVWIVPGSAVALGTGAQSALTLIWALGLGAYLLARVLSAPAQAPLGSSAAAIPYLVRPGKEHLKRWA
jgi:hypothetical protein